MRKVRNADGSSRFDALSYLTSRQVAVFFFSRRSLKKVLQADESEDEEVKHGEELNTRFERRSHSGNITSASDHGRRYA